MSAKSKKNYFKYGLLTTGLVSLAGLGTIYYYGKELAQPGRKSLEPYHHEWLDDPKAHGISIAKSTFLEGSVPCLIVTPDKTSHLGKRGKIVRKQLINRGLKLPALGSIVSNIVLLHGRNGRKEDLLPVAERYCAAGFRCIIPDLPAHGESPIKTVQFGGSQWEQEFPHALLLECASTYQFSATPSAIWGMSMGGSFATHSASSGAPWSSIVIVSSFDRLITVIENKCSIGVITQAVAWTCKQSGGADITQIIPCKRAQEITTPVMIAHGTEDSLITLAQGKRLYNSFASPNKKWIEVKGGTHSNVLTTPMPLYATMIEWALTH